jgi:hypothetical protein
LGGLAFGSVKYLGDAFDGIAALRPVAGLDLTDMGGTAARERRDRDPREFERLAPAPQIT